MRTRLISYFSNSTINHASLSHPLIIQIPPLLCFHYRKDTQYIQLDTWKVRGAKEKVSKNIKKIKDEAII